MHDLCDPGEVLQWGGFLSRFQDGDIETQGGEGIAQDFPIQTFDPCAPNLQEAPRLVVGTASLALLCVGDVS